MEEGNKTEAEIKAKRLRGVVKEGWILMAARGYQLLFGPK